LTCSDDSATHAASARPKPPKQRTGIDKRLYQLEIRKQTKLSDHEYEKLAEVPPGITFVGSPAFLFGLTERGVKVVCNFGRNMLGGCQKIWRRLHGGTTSDFILKKLLPRVLAAITDLEARIQNKYLSSFPFDPQDLQMALNYYDQKIMKVKEEITDEFEAGALTLKKREVRARQAGRTFPKPKGVSSPARKFSTAVNALASNRQSIVMPILEGKGWSQVQFAQHARVDYNTVRAFLKGEGKPHASTRKQMADALGIPLAKFPR
jgi:ribosome-binding protein aMBF1 (putative translation factor)